MCLLLNICRLGGGENTADGTHSFSYIKTIFFSKRNFKIPFSTWLLISTWSKKSMVQKSTFISIYMHCTLLEIISLTYSNSVRQFCSQLDNRVFIKNQILILLSACLSLNNYAFYYSHLYYSSITLLTWMKIILIYSRVNETRIRKFSHQICSALVDIKNEDGMS